MVRIGAYIPRASVLNSGIYCGTNKYRPWDLCAATSKLELELIQPHITQKLMLQGKVDARALRV